MSEAGGLLACPTLDLLPINEDSIELVWRTFSFIAWQVHRLHDVHGRDVVRGPFKLSKRHVVATLE